MLPSAARTHPRSANNFFFPAVNWFYRLSQMGFLRNFVIESACAPSTNDFLKTLRNGGVIQIPEEIFWSTL